MHRFYVNKVNGQEIIIAGAEQVHHLKDVLRLKPGDEVIAFDGEGNEFMCNITGLSKDKVLLSIKSKMGTKNKTLKITVACAIPKKSGMDEIVDNLTELGVDTIIPLETRRVIVKLAGDKKESRLERWQRIAQSAAQQSQRHDIPRVEPVTSLENIVANSQGYDLKLILAIFGERKPISEVIPAIKPENILILIGPEGDFTPEEIELAKSNGFVPVSLGDSVLRVGTAATAIAAYIKFCLTR